MKNELDITEAEWKVMEFLWKHPSSGMGAIREALESEGWSSSTVKTLVLRLLQKGAVKSDGRVRNSLYTAAVTEAECKRNETKNFLDRIYSGSVKMMVSNLVEGSRLSDDEVKSLMELIDKIED